MKGAHSSLPLVPQWMRVEKKQQLHIKRMWHVNKALGLDAECPTSLSPNLKRCNLPLYFISIMWVTCLANIFVVLIDFESGSSPHSRTSEYNMYTFCIHTATLPVLWQSCFEAEFSYRFEECLATCMYKKNKSWKMNSWEEDSLQLDLEKWYKTLILVKSFFSHETWPFLAPNEA